MKRPFTSPPRAAGALALWSTISALTISALTMSACQKDGAPLAPPDSYVVYEPGGSADPAGATLPAFREVKLDDPRAVPIHRSSMDGFLGELLRTDYLAKQLIRDGWRGQAFAAAARARAGEPTVLVLAGARMARPDQAKLGVGFSTAGTFGRVQPHADAMWIETGDDPPSDPAFVQTASGRVARLIAERIAGSADVPGGTSGATSGASAARGLIDGYALAMEVIGREWRVGEGPQGTLPPSAGTGTQRERFAGVRGNAFVFAGADQSTLRPGIEMLTDPGIVATVLYRMAQSPGIGRKVAPAEIYAPFVGQRVPQGVSPAAVLGPIRNFQVKLLCAWASAILAGRPPRDLIDLVTAYGESLPAERADAYRILVVTSYGATVKTGGVSPRPSDANGSLAELTALSAEVAAGRRTLRQGLGPK
jgi:hypothetical protein